MFSNADGETLCEVILSDILTEVSRALLSLKTKCQDRTSSQDTTPHTFHAFSKLSSTICIWLYIPCGPWPLFQFLNLYTVVRTPWTGE
jgi:hypothetical protein